MTFSSVSIKNFRSIQELTIDFKTIDQKDCFIFLGKNENGKSNILKALAILDKSFPITYQLDCNKDAQKKSELIEVRFTLDFNKIWYRNEFSKITKLPQTMIDIVKIERYVSFDKNTSRSDAFYIYLKDRGLSGYVIKKDNSLIQEITELEKTVKITEENIATILPEYDLLDKDKLEIFLEAKAYNLLDINTPKIIYWKPSDSYLINQPVNLQEFKNNTNISIPLRNIFNIASIKNEEIKNRIEQTEQDNEARFELAQSLSEEITNYINAIWLEQKIKIKITIENNQICVVNVEDTDYDRPKYQMGQRSDGFKQFISILLSLSVENKTKQLENKIILLDEPEVHLHPSGIKYLRDELLEISKNNLVLIATHSIYMVDRLNLNRHYGVVKEKSITSIFQIQKNNPYEEEVIYESLGTSIYEHVTPHMIIFEGRTDKEIFDIFSEKLKNNISIKNISAISASGANSIEKYVKFFNNKLINGFVVVDSDKKGKEVKAKIIKDNHNFNKSNTFEITDLISAKHKKFYTLEDLIPKIVIEECLKNEFSLELTLDDKQSFIEQIKHHSIELNEEKLKVDILKYIVNDLNEKIIEDIQKKYFLYCEFIENLYAKINN